MNTVSQAESITLHNRKPLALPFHRHIAKSKLNLLDGELSHVSAFWSKIDGSQNMAFEKLK